MLQVDEKRDLLRAALRGTHPVRAVGAHDGLTAKIVAEAGFEAVWVSSFELSASHGLPDASLLTMTQYLDAAEDVDAVIDIPVIADCDTGFGGPLNVSYLMQRYARRHIAAVCIEDKMFPKINSFAEAAQDLISAEEFALKIKAGKEVLDGDGPLLIARTEALISGAGVDEALDRGHAYAAAGADVVLVHSKSKRPDEVLEFGARWDLDVPLAAVPTTYSQVTEATLREAGYGLVIYANHSLRAAVRSVREVLDRLTHAGRAADVESRISPMAEIFALQGMPARFSAEP
ncbi:isocitrate lyase/phosphoenolpyruvate mutase family protein [Nocardia terpenica]|uniref:Phosphoenolpyruvate phosphomutase n=1 Tax=Nocardia terpenica TaxID=455432 RepID=A0A6G9Z4D0_9NOCA|nr:isocitrate lyase/phosphoenolpyruvate mutase family protein [Nocardia terpenica]QIS20251.1 phosphoenolpyruvate phosphomutase [Nocardia terpenica]